MLKKFHYDENVLKSLFTRGCHPRSPRHPARWAYQYR